MKLGQEYTYILPPGGAPPGSLCLDNCSFYHRRKCTAKEPLGNRTMTSRGKITYCAKYRDDDENMLP